MVAVITVTMFVLKALIASLLAVIVVFPPFHWVFLGRKREKERRKKGIAPAGLPLNTSIYFSF